MERKKWTAKDNVNDHLIQSREKRKWQIALRRYVLEGSKSSYYAPFFGLDIQKFKEWIASQFDTDHNWQNFSKAWQFDHVVPVSYFDFGNEDDMRLCWNFTNIRVDSLNRYNIRNNRIDALAAKRYFEFLFEQTGYVVCKKMTEKVTQLETSQLRSNEKVIQFIAENRPYLDHLSQFSSYEFDKLNTGIAFEKVLFEVNFLKRFGP